jgi:peptide/nickel transport system substrate-binding protein
MVSVRKRWTTVASCAAVTVLALSACGKGDGANGDGGPGGDRVYIEAIAGDPASLNPQFAGGPIPLRFGFAMLESLVEINDQYEISPGLAREWEFGDDNSMVTFYLEEGVEWHDGEPFTADDVAFNLEEIIPLQSFGGPLAGAIESIETPDEHTVVLHLSEQYGPLLESLSQQLMVPKHVYEGTDYVTNPANMAPVGTGPMMFESYSPGDEVILVRNPNWWRGETQIDRAIYPVMSDANTRALAMLNGEIDMAVLDPAQQDDVAAHPDLVLTDRGVFPQMIGLTFNALLPELEDPEVRALVFAAIDREAITRLALSGLGEPAETFYPDALDWAQHPDINFSQDFPRDIDAINAGLDAAGYPVQGNGYRFSLDARYVSTHPEAAATAEIIQSSLEEVHIQVNLEGAAVSVWEDAVWNQQDFGMSILRNTVGSDPSIGLTRWVACNSDNIPQNNASGVCDEELHDAASAAESTLDRDERAPRFHTVQERARDLIYWAPLAWYHGSYNTVNTSRWAGLDDGTGQTNNVPWLSVEWIGD